MWRELAGAVAVFVVVVAFRLSTVSITNDDYLHLALAQQVLLGAVPVRDFIDPGEFLFYQMSAMAQAAFGQHLLSEVMLDVLLLAAGYALVFVLAVRASRSWILGAAATAVAVLLMPRLYSYPKIFLYAVGLFLIWHYVDRRTARALVPLACWTAIAFLFRHDHGAVLGATACVTLGLVHWTEGPWKTLQALARYGAVVALLLAPFLVFVQANGGVGPYWRNMLATGRAEYERTVGPYPVFHRTSASPRISVRWADDVGDNDRRRLEERFRLAAGAIDEGRTWDYDLGDRSRANVAALVRHPAVEDTEGVNRTTFDVTAYVDEPNVLAWFYYLTLLLPVLALAVLCWPSAGADRPAPLTRPKVLATILLAALMYPFLLRAASSSAVADVGVVTAVLGAWLLGRGFSGGGARARRTSARRAATAALLTTTLVAAWKSEGGYAFAGFAGTRDGNTRSVEEQIAALRRSAPPFDDPAARYLFECTEAGDRVLVAGYAPDLYYKSGRGFAAGRPYFLSTLGTEEHERFSVQQLSRERVPVVLARNLDEDLAVFPAIHAYVARHYAETGTVSFGDTQYAVFADRRIAPACRYGADRLPCFAGCSESQSAEDDHVPQP